MIEALAQRESGAVFVAIEIPENVGSPPSEKDFARVAGILPIQGLTEQSFQIDLGIADHSLCRPMRDRIARRLQSSLHRKDVESAKLIVERGHQLQVMSQCTHFGRTTQ